MGRKREYQFYDNNFWTQVGDRYVYMAGNIMVDVISKYYKPAETKREYQKKYKFCCPDLGQAYQFTMEECAPAYRLPIEIIDADELNLFLPKIIWEILKEASYDTTRLAIRSSEIELLDWLGSVLTESKATFDEQSKDLITEVIVPLKRRMLNIKPGFFIFNFGSDRPIIQLLKRVLEAFPEHFYYQLIYKASLGERSAKIIERLQGDVEVANRDIKLLQEQIRLLQFQQLQPERKDVLPALDTAPPTQLFKILSKDRAPDSDEKLSGEFEELQGKIAAAVKANESELVESILSSIDEPERTIKCLWEVLHNMQSDEGMRQLDAFRFFSHKVLEISDAILTVSSVSTCRT